MNIYENYIETLLEDKPIGAKNRELWLNYLEKRYMSRDDIEDFFVTFVSEDKVGINPKSIWETPNGVYTYPVAWVLDNPVPFRGSVGPKKIKVLKILSKKVLSNKLSKNEYQEKIKQLQKEYGLPDKQIDSWVEDAKVKTYFGKLWNVTRSIAKNLKNEKTSNIWSTILLHLGYDVVIDNGDGVIHNNEKTQAVFLSPKSYKVVGEEFVDTTSRYNETNNVVTYSFLNRFSLDNDADKVVQYFVTNKKHILNFARTHLIDFVRIINRLLFGEDSVNGRYVNELMKIYKPLMVKYFNSIGPYKFSFLDVINHRDYFIRYFYNELSDKIYKNLKAGNVEIHPKVPESFILELFSDVVERLLKEENIEFIEALDRSPFRTVLRMHETLVRNLYKKYPDIFGRVHKEVLEE